MFWCNRGVILMTKPGVNMLKRKIYHDLMNWKNKSNGLTALLIEVARRVGKSYSVKIFGENEYASYLLMDFS